MDTVRLKFLYTLPRNNFYFRERIQTKNLNLFEDGGNRFIYTNNDWRKKRQMNNIYTPKYWIEDDYLFEGKQYFVIEFSVGKLINGENITEIKTNDLNRVVLALLEFFKKIEIRIFTNQILNTTPIVMAVGKNINLTKLYSCDLAIQILKYFDNRLRSDFYDKTFFNDMGGQEIYFNNKASTFKIYSKIPEVCNNATTKKELKIKKEFEQIQYRANTISVLELLRFELTLKKKQAINQMAKKYIIGVPTFEKLFDEKIWVDLLKNEVNKIYNLPIKNFIFLAMNNKPIIDAFLNKNIKSIKTKSLMRYLLIELQEKGLKNTRKSFLKEYSKRTWYNYMNIFKELEKRTNFSPINNVQSVEVINFILNKFDIEIMCQEKLL